MSSGSGTGSPITGGSYRVTPDEVKCLVGDVSMTDACMNTLIQCANALVSKDLASQPCHDEESLKCVELFISAHLVALNAHRVSSQKIGDAAETYSRPGVLLQGLHATTYGQSAIDFDCSDVLVNKGKMKLQTFVTGASF